MVGHELGVERSGKPSQLRKLSLAAWRFEKDNRSTLHLEWTGTCQTGYVL